jgi:hypothetical protein
MLEESHSQKGAPRTSGFSILGWRLFGSRSGLNKAGLPCPQCTRVALVIREIPAVLDDTNYGLVVGTLGDFKQQRNCSTCQNVIKCLDDCDSHSYSDKAKITFSSDSEGWYLSMGPWGSMVLLSLVTEQMESIF